MLASNEIFIMLSIKIKLQFLLKKNNIKST